MKIFRTTAALICMMILFSATSCVIVIPKDNGKHRGWYKNPHNPHNPNHQENPHPGNGKGKGNEKHGSGKH